MAQQLMAKPTLRELFKSTLSLLEEACESDGEADVRNDAAGDPYLDAFVHGAIVFNMTETPRAMDLKRGSDFKDSPRGMSDASTAASDTASPVSPASVCGGMMGIGHFAIGTPDGSDIEADDECDVSSFCASLPPSRSQSPVHSVKSGRFCDVEIPLLSSCNSWTGPALSEDMLRASSEPMVRATSLTLARCRSPSVSSQSSFTERDSDSDSVCSQTSIERRRRRSFGAGHSFPWARTARRARRPVQVYSDILSAVLRSSIDASRDASDAGRGPA